MLHRHTNHSTHRPPISRRPGHARGVCVSVHSVRPVYAGLVGHSLPHVHLPSTQAGCGTKRSASPVHVGRVPQNPGTDRVDGRIEERHLPQLRTMRWLVSVSVCVSVFILRVSEGLFVCQQVCVYVCAHLCACICPCPRNTVDHDQQCSEVWVRIHHRSPAQAHDQLPV